MTMYESIGSDAGGKYNWITDTNSKKGNKQLKNNDRVYSETDHGKQVIVLCDGASGRMHSGKGAEILGMAIGKFLLQNMDELIEMEYQEIRRKVFSAGNQRLMEAARENQAELKDYACTLIAVCIDLQKQKYMSLHLGDGMILCEENGQAYILSKPANGALRCQTFLFSEKNVQQIRIRIGNLERVQVLMLVSDGMYEKQYDFSGIPERLIGIRKLGRATDDQTYIRILKP